MAEYISLYGRIFLEGNIRTKTGLHIGAGRGAMTIGGLDNPVIRDAITQEPYIPASTIRGKMRSLLEKHYAKNLNHSIQEVNIHVCKKMVEKEGKKEWVADVEGYERCEVCPIFGVPAEFGVEPTRLIIRDVFLTEESKNKLRDPTVKTDLLYTEVKWEAAIDRITSKAVPRPIERIPPEVLFGPLEMVFNVFERKDIDRFEHVLEGMQIVEDDYLGGLGSRGSGKVSFESLSLSYRKGAESEVHHYKGEGFKFKNLQDLRKEWPEIKKWLLENLFPER